jgi:hypothetical protein
MSFLQTYSPGGILNALATTLSSNVFFFVLAIIASTSKVHAKECNIVLLFMYNVELISVKLLMKEVGVALMKPRNLGTQMGNFKVIARRDMQLSIFDIIIIEMCGEVVAFCVGSC